MKRIIIYGSSDFAKEVAWTIEAINATQNEYPEFKIEGYLDDNADDVLGGREWLEDRDIRPYHFIVAIGNPKVKKSIVQLLDKHDAKYANVIYPNTIHAKDIKLGKGIYIGAGNIITTGIEIQDHVIVNLSCTIGHKSKIGKYSCINPGVNISGGVTIEEQVYVGTNAVILQNLTIGESSVIGASAMVNKNVKPKSKMLGVPAKNYA